MTDWPEWFFSKIGVYVVIIGVIAVFFGALNYFEYATTASEAKQVANELARIITQVDRAGGNLTVTYAPSSAIQGELYQVRIIGKEVSVKLSDGRVVSVPLGASLSLERPLLFNSSNFTLLTITKGNGRVIVEPVM